MLNEIKNEKGIIKSVENILKTGDIGKLTRSAYDFLYLMSGFIAHYNQDGFMEYYRNVEDLRRNILRSSDITDTRYINDPYFCEGENAPYYAQKYRINQALGELARKYEGTCRIEELVNKKHDTL